MIISCRGVASGKVHYTVPYSFVTSNSLVLDILDEVLTPFEYVLFSIYNIDFSSKLTGSAQPQLTIENIKNITIVMPDTNTINGFVAITRPMLRLIFSNNDEIKNLIKLQEVLLSRLSH